MKFSRAMKHWLWLLPVLAVRAQTTADFFDDTIMQDVYLQMDPADWATFQAHYLENTYYPATFTWNRITLNIGIRSRGTGSRSPVKPNFTFKFDKYVKGQTFLGETTVFTKANNQDPSNLRDRLSMKFFQRMGLPAPRESFARIHLNGQFLGLSELIEAPDEQLVMRNLGENTGYLYQWNAIDRYDFEYLGPDPNNYVMFLDLKSSQSAPDAANFLGLVQAVNLSSDADFVAAVSKYLDPKQFLIHAAIENVLANSDGILSSTFGMNNFYFYQYANGSQYQFLPWDEDMSFDWYGWGVASGLDTNVLTRRLMAIPEYRNTYMSALAKAANLFGGPGGWADQELTREYNLIAADARNDPHKQCSVEGVMHNCGTVEFENAVRDMRAFTAQRAPFVLGSVGAATPSPADPQVTSAVMAGSASMYLAPGALVNVTGVRLGSAASAASGANLPRTLGNAWVAVDGVRAPILASSENAIQIQIPWRTRPGTSAIAVAVKGALSNTIEVPMADSSPAVVALTHSDGSMVTPSNPAARGEVLVAYAVGLGEVKGEPGVGSVTPRDALVLTASAPQVSIGGFAATPLFAGLTPGFVGLYQINFAVPGNCSTGSSIPMMLEQGGVFTSAALAVR
jgi:uncharacterized protein (TIGR03437 family)